MIAQNLIPDVYVFKRFWPDWRRDKHIAEEKRTTPDAASSYSYVGTR